MTTRRRLADVAALTGICALLAVAAVVLRIQAFRDTYFPRPAYRPYGPRRPQ